MAVENCFIKLALLMFYVALLKIGLTGI